ncbi:hypothetical protein KC19_10G040500 [Ceratodon purpureus]|uniref:Thioredoxin domain-containing protein n=1 Tax=Ceratodon purpureus TaxID=3225 RepID=A0A8T0GJ32_CERPU|nr:hypothetical protein KC19_10G040500 [Ceratodon purpureus]
MVALGVERIGTSACAMASVRGVHVGTWRAPRAVAVMGCRREGSRGVAIGVEVGRIRGGRGAGLVCRSSMKPLGESNGNVVEFQSEEEFNTILKDAGDKLIVLDISTTTCGPCKMIFPKLVEMSLQYPDAVFLKINGDINNDTRSLMRKWGVRAVPSFRFFKNGEQVHSHTGAKLEELKTRFAEHYGQPIKV